MTCQAPYQSFFWAMLSAPSRLPRASEERNQAEDYRTNDPKDQDHHHADAGTDLRPGQLGPLQCIHAFCRFTSSGDQPPKHESVEQVEGPDADFPEDTAFWLSDRVTALGAVKCFVRDLLIAGWARDCGHFEWLRFTLKSRDLVLIPAMFARLHDGALVLQTESGAAGFCVNLPDPPRHDQATVAVVFSQTDLMR